jgi:hypothetical protein
VRKKSLTQLKDSIRVKTRRTRGDSLARIVASLNRTLRGWFAYEELVRSHLHAVWLAEAKLALSPDIPEILDLAQPATL